MFSSGQELKAVSVMALQSITGEETKSLGMTMGSRLQAAFIAKDF